MLHSNYTVVILSHAANMAITTQSSTLHHSTTTTTTQGKKSSVTGLTISNTLLSPTTNLNLAIVLPVTMTVILILLIAIGVILPIACMIRRKMKLEKKRLLTGPSQSSDPLSSKPSCCKYFNVSNFTCNSKYRVHRTWPEAFAALYQHCP